MDNNNPYKYTNKQLMQILKDNKVKGYSTLKTKEDMINKLIQIGYFENPNSRQINVGERGRDINISNPERGRDINISNPETLDIDYLTTLPYELLTRILVLSDPRDILNACKGNKSLSRICRDDKFWAEKANYDFGYPVNRFINPLVKPKLSGYQKYNKVHDAYDRGRFISIPALMVMEKDYLGNDKSVPIRRQYGRTPEYDKDEYEKINFEVEALLYFYKPSDKVIVEGLSNFSPEIFELFFNDKRVIGRFRDKPDILTDAFLSSIDNCFTYNAKRLLESELFDIPDRMKSKNIFTIVGQEHPIFYALLCHDDELVNLMLSNDRVRNNIQSPYDLFVQLVKGLDVEGVKIMLRDYDFDPAIRYRGDSKNNIMILTLIGVKASDEQKYMDKIDILNLLINDKRIDITIDNDRLVQAAIKSGDREIRDIIINKTIESLYEKIKNLETLKFDL